MKSKLLKLLSVVAPLALISTLVPASGRSTSETSDSRELEGMWSVQVTPIDCETGEPLPVPSFTAQLTFVEGGTIVGSSTTPGFAAGQRGTDLGIWNREGPHTYRAKTAAFVFFTTPPKPPSPGFFAGMQTVTQTIEFTDNPDEFTSIATSDFFDTEGKLYRHFCAAAVAQRFE